jgi:hypothetical protein
MAGGEQIAVCIKTQIVVQLVLLGCHIANGLLDLFDPTGKVIAAAVIAFLEGAAGILQAFYNPNGTPATQAWQRPQEPPRG